MVKLLEQEWDERRWILAQKSDNPQKAYDEMQEQVKSVRQATAVDELPEEQRKWLRAT